MRWRHWSVIVVLLLANYLVFSTLAVWVFPPSKPVAPTHTIQATFTPAAPTLQRVGPLPYDFVTDIVTATLVISGTPSSAPPTRRP